MKNIISLGAGVQSSTMALMATAGELTPMPDAAIFADTGDEPRAVYEWLAWLETKLSFPVVRVKYGVISVDSLKVRVTKKEGRHYQRIPIPAFLQRPDGQQGIMGRTCTTDYKIRPILKAARRIGEIKRGQKTVGVIEWIGISWDEIHRMKMSREPWCEHTFPLVDRKMTRQHCLDWMKTRGFPEPPRSACVFCPFHSDFEWKRLSEKAPDDFAKAVKFEADMRAAVAAVRTNRASLQSVPYLTRYNKPLGEIDFSDDTESHPQLELGFGNECEGLCGV